MTSILLAFVWFAVLWFAVAFSSSFARRLRLAHAVTRPETRPPRHVWGGLANRPAGDYAALRALAGGARLSRGRTSVVERSRRLARVSRSLSLVSTLSALSLLPFAVPRSFDARIPAPAGAAFGETSAVLDLDYGLGLLAVLMLISCVSSTAAGLAERGTWARLAALRVSTEGLLGIALVFLLLAPIVLESDSLRLADIVWLQQQTFTPFVWLTNSVAGLAGFDWEAIQLPGWFVFRQPLTALLMVPALHTLTQRPFAYHESGNTVSASGLGFDADPGELYWARLDASFSQVLGAALFVALFLGAGGIPYLDVSPALAWMQPKVGVVIPVLLVFTLELGCFVAKLVLVLIATALIRQATGRTRSDQSLRLLSRRLLPLAWANFLLIAAIELLEFGLVKGSAL